MAKISKLGILYILEQVGEKKNICEMLVFMTA